MAAAMFRTRTGTGLCVRCVHRELCRVVWRPQAALFSSKPSDRKLPRRTHIKKAKPQPTVDIAKLLEQLFSQRRPGTAPPAARKAQVAKASSLPIKLPTTSSVKVSTSDVPPLSKAEPAVSVLPAASSVSRGTVSTLNAASLSPQPKSPSTNQKTSFSSETPQQSPLGFIQDLTGVSSATVPTTSASPPTSTAPAPSGPEAATVEHQTSADRLNKVESSAEPDELAAAPALPLSAHMTESVEKSPVSAAAVESLIETTTEPPVEASPASVEALEMTASDVGPVEPMIDVTVITAAQNIQTRSTDAGEVDTSYTSTAEPSVETKIELSADTSIAPLETSASIAAVVEGTVDPTMEAEADKEAVVNVSYYTKEEPLIETTVEASLTAVKTLETKASVERPVETTVDATVDGPTEQVQAKSIDLGLVNISHTTTVEPLSETTIDPSVEASPPPLETLETRASVAEGAVETTVEAKTNTAAQAEPTSSSDAGTVEPLLETTVETSTEAISSPIESQAAVAEGTVETTIETEIEEGVVQSEQMTFESVTLHSVQASMGSFKTNELLQTKCVLDEKAEEQLQELLVQTGITAEHRAAAEAENSSEHESEILTKDLSMWDSLSEDLQELEGETGTLVTELLCHVPAVLYRTPHTVSTSSAPDQPAGANGDSLQTEEKATEEGAMTLESITLAEVKAEVESLEPEVLQETNSALEKEADVLAKEERMEVKTEIDVFEDTSEAEILTLDSISEATDAIEAGIAVLLEAMLGSEQGLWQPPDTLNLVPQNEIIDQEAEKESGEREVSVLEAMSLESVTLADVEASLGTLENESLSETMSYLENAAEILAGKRRMVEVVTASEEATEALNDETLSLPEADSLSEDLQTEALMEELLFILPGHVAGVTAQISSNILDVTVAMGSAAVDTAAAEADDFAASPAPEEVTLGQEMLEEGAQTEVLENEKDLDPVQRCFLEKIREYNNMRRLNGGPVESEPDYERSLSEETAKLQRLYGGGDLSSFPQFTFPEPKMDQDSK